MWLALFFCRGAPRTAFPGKTAIRFGVAGIDDGRPRTQPLAQNPCARIRQSVLAACKHCRPFALVLPCSDVRRQLSSQVSAACAGLSAQLSQPCARVAAAQPGSRNTERLVDFLLPLMDSAAVVEPVRCDASNARSGQRTRARAARPSGEAFDDDCRGGNAGVDRSQQRVPCIA